MKTRLGLGLGLLVGLLIAGHASAGPLLITLDEYGTALVTQDGVTTRFSGHPIPGGGIGYRWVGWGGAGDINEGSLLLTEGDGNVSDVINFHNVGPEEILFYSDGTDGFDSPADRLAPLPVDFPSGFLRDQITETGPEGNNGVFYGPLSAGAIGNLRGFGFPLFPDSVTYHFISDGRLPEPSSLLLLVSGFAGLAVMEWRRHRRN